MPSATASATLDIRPSELRVAWERRYFFRKVKQDLYFLPGQPQHEQNKIMMQFPIDVDSNFNINHNAPTPRQPLDAPQLAWHNSR